MIYRKEIALHWSLLRGTVTYTFILNKKQRMLAKKVNV